jgi:UDP-glucose:glycoprotein glucosyltransferase
VALASWLAAPVQPGQPTAKACQAYIQHNLGASAPASAQPLLSLQLATRQQSPRLEFFTQVALQSLPGRVAESHCCVLAAGATHITGPTKVANALQQLLSQPAARGAGAAERSTVDHVMRRANSTARDAEPHIAVLYGPPGAPCFGAMHSAMLTALQDGSMANVDYVVRPVVLPGCEPASDVEVSSHSCLQLGRGSRPAMCGYGVQLVLKDMEYSQVRSVSVWSRVQGMRRTFG